MKLIAIDALDLETERLWGTVLEVARALEGGRTSWCLVGGLMVASFAIEAGHPQRATTDIDILADARRRPSGTEVVSDLLTNLGAELYEIGGLDAERGFRFELDGQVIDVLAPEGLGRPAFTRGRLETIQIPGGSQALKRIEAVTIAVGDEHARVFRPTLIGAILLKARALLVHSRPDDQRYDLITLLGLMEDPRSAIESISRNEIAWLRDVVAPLDINEAGLDGIVDPDQLRIARAAYRRLIT